MGAGGRAMGLVHRPKVRSTPLPFIDGVDTDVEGEGEL
ncbi:hypothetical protein M3J09_008555 [Ascochyta lentis]